MIKKECIVKDCLNKRSIRGLCINHYASAFKRVKRGQFTWKDLEDKGLVLKAREIRLNDGNLWEVKK